MNIFILDTNIDECAKAHCDLHLNKMQIEAAQMLATTLWVDKLFGYVPTALDKDQLAALRAEMAKYPTFMPKSERPIAYKASHPNHPCSIWVRSSLDNYEWLFTLLLSLGDEWEWREFRPHASCAEAQGFPEPEKLVRAGLTAFAQALPDEYKSPDAVDAYRHYYMGEKAPFCVWRRRGKPYWWDDMLADYKDGSDPHEGYLKTTRAVVNKNKPWSKMGLKNVLSK